MRNEFKMRIKRTIKESSYILTLTLKSNQRVIVEEEARVVATTTEDVEEARVVAIITEVTGDKEANGRKEGMHPE